MIVHSLEIEGLDRSHFNAKPISYVIDKAGCFNCISHKPNSVKGYPSINGVHMHRVLYQSVYGLLTPSTVVRHSCDNRICINISHLLSGSLADNNRDRMIRGRSRPRRGVENGRHKLTEQQVAYIRSSAESSRSIATQLGVGKSIINYIRSGESWAGKITKSR